MGHELAELFLVQNRARLSDYLERIEEIALDGFMGAYREIKIMGIETREAMDAFEEPSFCKDAVRNRWELQVTRFGINLSSCLGVTRDYLNMFNDILNGLHDESRVYKVIIPNAGINVLSQTSVSTNQPLSPISAKLPCLDFRRPR